MENEKTFEDQLVELIRKNKKTLEKNGADDFVKEGIFRMLRVSALLVAKTENPKVVLQIALNAIEEAYPDLLND